MFQNRKILLLGAGGHCLSVIDSLISSYNYSDIGIIDKVEEGNQGKRMIMGVPVVGSDDDLLHLFESGYTDAFITVGSVGNPSLRKKLYQQIKEIGFQIPNIIDKTSVISEYATLAKGIYVGKNAVINANTMIGCCAIINTSATIEHECNIGEFVHIAPGSILCGNVTIGNHTHIGAGSIVKQGLHIGSDTMIGMGSVVISNIGSKVTAYGNPCREVK